MIPLELLEERTVQTSNITGTGPADQSPGVWRPTLERVFQTPVTQMLGITQESVPMGQPVYPVVTDGGAPSMLAEAAGTHPRRRDPDHQFTGAPPPDGPHGVHRRTASPTAPNRRSDAPGHGRRIPQRDGTASAGRDGTGVNVSGITHGIAAATNPSAATTYQEYSSLAANAVDGIWPTPCRTFGF